MDRRGGRTFFVSLAILAVIGTSLTRPAQAAAQADASQAFVIGISSDAIQNFFTAKCGGNRGQFEGAKSEPGRVFELTLTVRSPAGQIRALEPTSISLADVEASGVPAGGTVQFDVIVPWDGLDEAGAPITGTVEVDYTATLVLFPNGVRTELASFATTGTFVVDIAT